MVNTNNYKVVEASENEEQKDKSSKKSDALKLTAAMVGGDVAQRASKTLVGVPLGVYILNDKRNKLSYSYYPGYFKDKKNLRKLIDAMGYKDDFVINDVLKSGRLSLDPRDIKRNISNITYLDRKASKTQKYRDKLREARRKAKNSKKDVDKLHKIWNKYVRTNSVGALYSKYDPKIFYPDKKKVVYAPLKNLYFTAHELGHATGRGRLTSNKPLTIFSHVGAKIPILSAPITGALYDPNKKLEDQSTAAKVALGTTGVGATAAGLVLAEEARASIRGARKLKETGLGNYRGAIKTLGPAFLSYVTTFAAAPYLGYKASQFIKNKLQNNKEEDK